jgi:RND superfamily putative drug exporter
MFDTIWNLIIRYRVAMILFWVVLSIFMATFAPSLKEVGSLDVATFLPKGTESLQMRDLTDKYFPGTQAADSGMLVFHNPRGLSEQDMAYARDIYDWLLSDTAPPGLQSVTAIVGQPQLQEMMLSPDDTTMLMQFGLAEIAFETGSMETVDAVRAHLDAPSGLEVYVSGQAGIATDLFTALAISIDRTTWITVILIIVLLLLIYRSPVAALVPLITIAVAFIVARGALGYLAQGGLQLWSQVDAFLVVLVFGVGTDYCLFIVSRYREELSHNHDRFKANIITMTKIGAVIVASAVVVIVGLAGLGTGRLEMLKTMGPALGIAIFITMLAALTLVPALTSVFGKKLFWPLHNNLTAGKSKRFIDWAVIAKYTTRQPAVTALVVVIALLVPYLALPDFKQSFNMLSELPDNMDSVSGSAVLERHYDIGEMMPLVALMVPSPGQNMTDPSSLAALSKVSAAVAGLNGVQKVQSVVQPNGTLESSNLIEVPGQLDLLRQQIGLLQQQVALDPQSLLGAETAGTISLLEAYFVELGQGFPWIEDNSTFQEIGVTLQEFKLALSQIPEDPVAVHEEFERQLGVFLDQIEGLAAHFPEEGDYYFLPRSLLTTIPEAQGLMDLFFSSDQEASRFYVVLKTAPYSLEAFETVRLVRTTIDNVMADTKLGGGEILVGGSIAELADVQQVIGEDFNRIMLVVISGIFLVLAVLLRSLVAPVYLLATVLLSFGTTMGIITWLFQGVLGYEGVNYIVPVILFVLLLALGEDYNIFLTSRIKEEWQLNPSREGIRVATTATGGIITACGIILAGTFAALTSAPIQTLVQVGAALAIGILVDAFLVRALLVPSIAALLGRWNWWPFSRG